MEDVRGLEPSSGGFGVGRDAVREKSRRHHKNSSIRPKMTSIVFLWRPSFNSPRSRHNPLKSYFPVDLDHLVC